MNRLEQLIRDYLKEGRLMQLATVKDGQPWICTVNYSVDENNNLHWISLKNRRHSQELTAHQKVAGAIVKNPGVKQGLQFEGIAEEVKYDDLEKVNAIHSERYGHKPERLEQAKSGDPNSRTYYRLKPTLFVLFDEINYPENPRQEIIIHA